MLIEFAVSFAEVRRDSFPVVAIPAVDLVSATDDCPRSPPPVRSNTALEPEATAVVRGDRRSRRLTRSPRRMINRCRMLWQSMTTHLRGSLRPAPYHRCWQIR
jgi:hypothetical protein